MNKLAYIAAVAFVSDYVSKEAKGLTFKIDNRDAHPPKRGEIGIRWISGNYYAAPEQGEEVDPLIAGGEVEEIACDYADENFDERNRDAHSDRDQTRDQRERHPNRCNEPNILKNDARSIETDPNMIEHNKTPACAPLRQQESSALKPISAVLRFSEGKLHCLRWK